MWRNLELYCLQEESFWGGLLPSLFRVQPVSLSNCTKSSSDYPLTLWGFFNEFSIESIFSRRLFTSSTIHFKLINSGSWLSSCVRQKVSVEMRCQLSSLNDFSLTPSQQPHAVFFKCWLISANWLIWSNRWLSLANCPDYLTAKLKGISHCHYNNLWRKNKFGIDLA